MIEERINIRDIEKGDHIRAVWDPPAETLMNRGVRTIEYDAQFRSHGKWGATRHILVERVGK